MDISMIINFILGVAVPFIFQLIKKIKPTFFDDLQGFWVQMLVVALSFIIAIVKVILEGQFNPKDIYSSIGIIFTASQIIYAIVFKAIPKKE